MAAIRLTTGIPGPNSQQIMARRHAAVPRGVSHATPVVAARAEGAIVEDVDGNRFIDMAGGIGTMNVGHGSPAVLEAVRAQLERFTHACFSVTAYESYVALAERLARLTPGGFPKKTLLVNTGAEAVENAVKIARHATGRPGVLVFEDAFHGRTLLALSMTSKVRPYKAGFGPFVADVHRVPYDYCYRCTLDKEPLTCGTACIAAIEDHFERYVDPGSLAAVVVEPVLGEGGFVVPPPEFLLRLAEVCRRHAIVVVADEVQTGFGRTGKMFACEHSGLEPDILVTAKSLAGGLPLGAVVGRADLMDSPGVGGLGGTFAGNPLALAAAHAVLDTFESGRLLERAEAIGARMEGRGKRWLQLFPLVGDMRRLGAMVGIELVTDRKTKTPAKDAANALARMAYERGVLLLTAGTYGNIIRSLVPLVISDDELDEALDVLEGALSEIAAGA